MALNNKVVVLCNCGSLKEARRIAQALVKARLAACVNVGTAPVESIYWWKGTVECAKEFPLMVKTSAARFQAVERKIRELHSYDVPEVIALPIVAGSKKYLGWLTKTVRV